MISHFHTHAQNNRNSEKDHNLLSIPQNVVPTTQLRNYKNLPNATKKGDVRRTLYEVRTP
jgi:hypothetical protein